ncbi:hypothetical protein [Emticicia sp. W12TSBA100-4]|uniref:hypothetical protein n=1 Tax=Emticicia sp. W12TSBA100-4 TaxID=3160965 RepID=UPI003305AA81
MATQLPQLTVEHKEIILSKMQGESDSNGSEKLVCILGEIILKEKNSPGWWIKTYKFLDSQPLNPNKIETDGGEFFFLEDKVKDIFKIPNTDFAYFFISSDDFLTSNAGTQTPCTRNKIEIASQGTSLSYIKAIVSLR